MRKNHNSIHLILEAISLSVIALLIPCFSTNLNISLTGEKTVLKYWNAFIGWITSGRDKAPDEGIVFINVANGKQLVNVSDVFGKPMGKADITNRSKREDVLELIKASADY